jgi:16S rRNA processing protein RimM
VTELITVGRVGRPHGLEGAFVVEDASDAPERFAVGSALRVDGDEARIVESKRAGGRPVIRLDRDVPRGAALQLPRERLPEPEEGSYYVFELIGLAVEEEGGRPLGRVVEVAPGPANDVLELDEGHALPLVDACVQEVDLDAGRIVVRRGFVEAE